MALRTAVAVALAVTFLGGATLLLVGFFSGRLTIELPGFLELRSGTAGADVELWFNPLAPIVVVLVLSMVIWLAGRAVRSVI